MRLPYRNNTVFAGYVGNEPELRKLASGDATVSVRIVAKHSWKIGDQWHTQDEWATAVFYRNLAEDFAEQGVKKGGFVHVEGRRHTRKWTDGSGRPKVTHEIIVTDWHEVALPATRPPAPTTPAPAKAAPAEKNKPAQPLPPVSSTASLA